MVRSSRSTARGIFGLDNVLVLIGRALLAIIFLYGGIHKFTDIGSTAAYFGSLDLPVPTATAFAVAALEFFGGLALLAGFGTRPVAHVLGAFTVAAGLVAHSNFADPVQVVHFLKNLAIAGGLLVLAAHGGGRLSLD